MGNNNRISFDTFIEGLGEYYSPTIEVQWNGINITVKKSLSVEETMQFVHNVADMCFSEEGEYHPEIMDFAIRCEILTRYANFDLPDNVGKRYWMVYASNVVEVICAHINIEQLSQIKESIVRKITYMCDSDVTFMRSKWDDIYTVIKRLEEQFSEMFDSVSEEDVKAAISALNGGIDPAKVAQAYKIYKKDAGDGND